MAKNYILEPTAFVLGQGATVVYHASSIIPISIFENSPEMVNVEIDGSVFYGKIFYYDVDGYDECLCCVMDVDNLFPDDSSSEWGGQHFIATIELWEPSEYDIEVGTNCSVEVNHTGQYVGLESITVSIYTETEDYPIKNFTHTHTEPAENDIEDIIQSIYFKLNVNVDSSSAENTPLDEQENLYWSTDGREKPAVGHSPMDRLVIAVALLNGFGAGSIKDVFSEDIGGANQIKRIANIIRGNGIN